MAKSKKVEASHNKVYLAIIKFIKYEFYGLLWPFIFIFITINNIIYKSKEVDMDKLRESSKRIYEKDKAKEQAEKKKSSNNYINEELKIETNKKDITYYLNVFFDFLALIPGFIKQWYNNLGFVQANKNRKAFESGQMLIDFASEDQEDENRGKKVIWEYVAFTPEGKKRKGHFTAFSRVDVQSFLLGEGLTVYSIRTSPLIQVLYGTANTTRAKYKNKDLIFLLTQLSTYIKSGITLVESLNILIRQVQKRSYKEVLREVNYDLNVGESLSSALEKRGECFPKLLINMVKASELTGELPEALDDMAQYYTETEESRKEMISALTYPSIVFVFTIGVVAFVLLYVVPKFVDIYKSIDESQIPKFTLIVLNISNYLKANFITILIVLIVVILINLYLYKYIKTIRTLYQYIAMHIPVIKDVIIFNEVTMFSKTFASLLSHNVYITDSMEILNKITNNEIYKMMIMDTVANLARGDKISKAFKDQWAFPIPAYEMIVTGEKTGELAEMMSKVSTYYQGLHRGTVARIKALVEPILIIFLTFCVGGILLAVIVPMFNMYSAVQSLG